jgi:hypothetical protein
MVRTIDLDEDIFGFSVKYIECGIHRRVVSEAFKLVDLSLEVIAS